MNTPIALSIAGFDPSNGAGITADLQVFAAHHLFGTSAITAITVQNTLGVSATQPVDPAILLAVLESLWSDLPPAGIKIGMTATAAIVKTIVKTMDAFLQRKLQGTDAPPNIPIVLDPVITSSSGAPLLDPEGVDYLRDELLRHVTWLTPNWQELALLTRTTIHTTDDLHRSMDILAKLHPHLHIVATGGDQNPPEDLLHTPNAPRRSFTSTRIESTSTHGTGCAFSSALLSNLIQNQSAPESVQKAKTFVEQAIRHAPALGQGHGPLNLLWPLQHPSSPANP